MLALLGIVPDVRRRRIGLVSCLAAARLATVVLLHRLGVISLVEGRRLGLTGLGLAAIATAAARFAAVVTLALLALARLARVVGRGQARNPDQIIKRCLPGGPGCDNEAP